MKSKGNKSDKIAGRSPNPLLVELQREQEIRSRLKSLQWDQRLAAEVLRRERRQRRNLSLGLAAGFLLAMLGWAWFAEARAASVEDLYGNVYQAALSPTYGYFPE